MNRIPLLALVAFALLLGSNTLPAAQTLNEVAGHPPAPRLVLHDMDGQIHRLDDYRGRPLIVNFWATWCPPCRREMPSMERAWKKLHKEGIAMLAVNMGEDRDTVFRFMADYPVSFPVLFDSAGKTTERWPIRGLPTTFILDPSGRIVYQAIGGRNWDDPALLSTIRRLKSPPPTAPRAAANDAQQTSAAR